MEKPKKPKKPKPRRPVDIKPYLSVHFHLCRKGDTKELVLVPEQVIEVINTSNPGLPDYVERGAPLNERSVPELLALCTSMGFVTWCLSPDYDDYDSSFTVYATVKRTDAEVEEARNLNSRIESDYEADLTQWEQDCKEYEAASKAWKLAQAEAVVERLRNS